LFAGHFAVTINAQKHFTTFPEGSFLPMLASAHEFGEKKEWGDT